LRKGVLEGARFESVAERSIRFSRWGSPRARRLLTLNVIRCIEHPGQIRSEMVGHFTCPKMWTRTQLLQVLLGVTRLTQAQSPSGIFPATPSLLQVSYQGSFVSPGVAAPSLGS